MAQYNREKGDKADVTDRSRLEQAIRNDPVLTALYKKNYSDITDQVANNIDNTAFKKAMLRLAWILIRRLTK
jgi:hypothetical protein